MQRQLIGWSAIGLVALGSCFAQPPYKDGPASRGGSSGTAGSSDAGNDSGGTPPVVGNQICASPVKASELLPARANVVSDEAVPPEREVFVSTLFGQFKAECGACHYDAALGGFKVGTESDFANKVDGKVLEHIKSDDPLKFMPPPNSGGVPWSERKSDAVTELAARLEEWIAAGRPSDVYFVKNDTSQKPYVFSGELGTSLTNLGNCIPDTAFAFGSAVDDMDKLDAMFAAAQPEPFSLDEVVPGEDQLGLPLYLEETDLTTFDSATLARNGVVAFVPTYPLWTDKAGKLRHVRVPRGESIRFNKQTQEFEIPANTRFYKTFFKDVIDRDGNPTWRKMETRVIVARPDKVVDGRRVPQALFGTYQWDEDETRATLVTAAQRNGEPFKDLIVTYTPDEQKAQIVRDTMPLNLTYELEYQGLLRHYGIPGKERCIQCHMGSHNNSFVLGFSPLQIRRRKTGEGGTHEPTEDDELSQLTRLIAYGVVTGIDNEDDVKLLEESQGDRKPRNDYELKAQGYLVGNCAHCHNPNGYPSVAAPELKDVLRFWPDAEGGIFQFPLERYSPRVFRGNEAQPIAYITPSLYDVWPLLWQNKPGWTPKLDRSKLEDVNTLELDYMQAPWRSLIWRNVQTPFPYADDSALYPRMPMNTANFDCRAQRVLGDWMVSIPATRKRPEIFEDFYPKGGLQPGQTEELAQTDREPQPFVEVLPGSPDYDKAVMAAQQRLAAFHESQQYKTCLEPADIIDLGIYRANRDEPGDTSVPPDGVPDLPHWVETDLTERAGPYSPRRDRWDEVLVKAEPTGGTSTVIKMLREPSTRLTPEFEKFAKTPFPMAMWKKKDGCDFSKEQTAGSPSLQGDNRPEWLDFAKVPNDAPIYSPLPGQAVFDMICSNCHGRQADSRGRQAGMIQELSGGRTRVANLRDGLFGPPESPGQALADTFGKLAGPDATARDWAARYLAFMALGGTEKTISKTVLGQVASADVAGAGRLNPLIGRDDVNANMLESARVACQHILPTGLGNLPVKIDKPNKFGIRYPNPSLIETNGDAELWQRLCSVGNRPVVRVLKVEDGESGGGRATFWALHWGSAYPAGAPVGNHRGETVNGLDPTTNFFPVCVGDYEPKTDAELWRQANPDAPPLCPEGFVTPATQLQTGGTAEEPISEANDWAIRGAINAGFAVFTYLEAVTKGEYKPVRYDECQLLK